MRGRILWASLLVLALAGACSRKDSLYIDTSKDGPAPVEPAGQKPAEPAAKPAGIAPPAAPAASKS